MEEINEDQLQEEAVEEQPTNNTDDNNNKPPLTREPSSPRGIRYTFSPITSGQSIVDALKERNKGILTSLLGKEPKLMIITTGSRGDVQPYMALSKEMKVRGWKIGLATHRQFEAFVQVKIPPGNRPCDPSIQIVEYGRNNDGESKFTSFEFLSLVIYRFNTLSLTIGLLRRVLWFGGQSLRYFLS